MLESVPACELVDIERMEEFRRGESRTGRGVSNFPNREGKEKSPKITQVEIEGQW